jgi:hypothetical protein
MSNFVRMTGLLTALREDSLASGSSFTWNGTAIAAVRKSGAGSLHAVVTDDPDELRTELATATTLDPPIRRTC